MSTENRLQLPLSIDDMPMTLQERMAEVQVSECTDLEALKAITLQLMQLNRAQKLLLMQYASQGL